MEQLRIYAVVVSSVVIRTKFLSRLLINRISGIFGSLHLLHRLICIAIATYLLSKQITNLAPVEILEYFQRSDVYKMVDKNTETSLSPSRQCKLTIITQFAVERIFQNLT